MAPSKAHRPRCPRTNDGVGGVARPYLILVMTQNLPSPKLRVTRASPTLPLREIRPATWRPQLRQRRAVTVMAAAHAFHHLRNDDNVQRCLRGSASSTPSGPPQTPPRPTSSTSTVSRSLPPAVRAAQTSRLSSPQLWINLLSRAFRPTAPPFPPPGPSTRSRPPTSVSGFQTMAAAASSPRVTSSQRLARRASLPSPPPPFHSSCKEPLPPCLSARTPTLAAQDRSRRTSRRS